MTVRTVSTWVLSGVLVLLPRLVAAQAADNPPRISIAAGAGIANPLHGDFDFTAKAWEADVRLAMSRHALFEVAVGEWRHSQESFGQKTTYSQRTLEANVLFTAASGRVRFTSGGGVGLLQFHRESVTEFSNASASAQAVGGADVRLAGGLAVYGQVRFIVPFTDPGGSDLRFTAGLRLGFGR